MERTLRTIRIGGRDTPDTGMETAGAIGKRQQADRSLTRNMLTQSPPSMRLTCEIAGKMEWILVLPRF
jgi:hypothetical protein